MAQSHDVKRMLKKNSDYHANYSKMMHFISLFLSERRSNAFNHHKSCKRTGEGTYGQIYKENTDITISLQD